MIYDFNLNFSSQEHNDLGLIDVEMFDTVAQQQQFHIEIVDLDLVVV